MQKILVWVVVLALILIGGYWYMNGGSMSGSSMGSYAYMCDDGSEFSMSPSEDVMSLTITPGNGAKFSEMTLSKDESASMEMGGQHFQGDGVTFVGAGEEVQLTVNDVKTVCNPVPSTESPPWNWGDAGEGGSMKPDVGLVVSESIVGKWQSTEDEKFIREFKDDATAVDMYEGEDDSNGTWKVFTAANPVDVDFTIESDAVYVQMMFEGMDAPLHFKVSKLTPDELELIFMDRGGVLMFKAVQ